jgi:hypothetical protein
VLQKGALGGWADSSTGNGEEAHLADIGGQIDVNGDGQIGSNDMEIQLVNLTGTLHDNNFLLV